MKNEQEKHFIVFKLGNEEYAVLISFVREIIKPAESIIHLRQNIIPVVALGKRLKVPDTGLGHSKKKIIIVAVQEKLIGLIVDLVGEVLRIDDKHIHPVPEALSTIDTRYLQGVIRIENRVILLMDIEKVLNKEELKQMLAT